MKTIVLIALAAWAGAAASVRRLVATSTSEKPVRRSVSAAVPDEASAVR